MRPCRSGSANVSWPSPPYVVPISVNSTSFSEIGMSCPWQSAQPAGAKLPANILISPTYGCAMSAPAREDALERDAPVEDEQRLPVLVRLASARVGDHRRAEVRVWGTRVRIRQTREDPDVGLVAVRQRRTDEVGVACQLGRVDGVELLARTLALGEAIAQMK